MKELILVRHGETVHNVAGIAQGWQDSELSERGAGQVQALARRLKAHGVDTLYSSPLQRALATAEAIRAETGLEIQTLDELREMNYGAWEGRSFLDVRREYEETYRRWIVDGSCPCPEGESHNDLLRRMASAFEHIRGNGTGRRVVVVTHGTAIRVGATALLNLPVMASRHFAQDNASMNVFVWRDRWVLKTWNDTTHCEER